MTLKSGFTLLESTIVIGIVSLLLTIGANLFVFSKQAARDAVRKTDIEQIRAALEFYKEEDANRYYPADIIALNNTYMDKIPKDPLINTQHEYCYSLNPETDSTNYVLAAELERGGPSSCNCGNLSYNYCFGPYGVLLAPTPTIVPPTQSATNTPIISTPTPTQTPLITCFQIGSAKTGETATLYSGQEQSSWTITNTLNCSPGVGTGSVFTTVCQQAGSTTVYVTNGLSSNSCILTITSNSASP